MMKEECYLHIGNGGITFGVSDEKGPTINIEASHFGNITNSMKIHTDKESLLKLGEMLIKAANAEYSEEYCCKATLIKDKCCECSNK